MLLKKLNNMPNTQTKVELQDVENNDSNDLELHEDVINVQMGFLKHLFWIVDPDNLIDKLARYRAANDDVKN